MTDQMSSGDMGTAPPPAGQDNKQRNIIIIVAVAAGALLLCCCCLLVLSLAIPWQDILYELDLTRILPLVMTL